MAAHWLGMGLRDLVTAIAAEQHGAIAFRQLAPHEITRQQIRTLVAHGDLARVGRTVYVVAGSPDTWERRLWIGLLAVGPEALVSHEAAATLHRFDRSRPDPIEFLVPRGQRRPPNGLTVHSSRTLRRTDRVTVRGMPCTSATRTLLDLAVAGVESVRLGASIDSAVRHGVTSPIVLARRLAQLASGDHTAASLGRLLPDSGGHSILERRFLELVRRAGLSRPELQVVRRSGGRTIARVDCLWADVDLVVEVSGRLGHATDLERERQAIRRDELEDQGLRVKELSYGQVVHRPAEAERHLRRWLAAGQGSG